VQRRCEELQRGALESRRVTEERDRRAAAAAGGAAAAAQESAISTQRVDDRLAELEAGAYTRPLFGSI